MSLLFALKDRISRSLDRLLLGHVLMAIERRQYAGLLADDLGLSGPARTRFRRRIRRGLRALDPDVVKTAITLRNGPGTRTSGFG